MSMSDISTAASPTWHAHPSEPFDDKEPARVAAGAEDAEFGFFDFLDVINPLQHLPVVGSLYREMTGDAISDTARMAGGSLWGGPIGLIAAVANTVMQEETGQDMGASALAWIKGEEGDASAETVAGLANDDVNVPSRAPLEAEMTTALPASVAMFGGQVDPSAMQQVAGGQAFSGNQASALDAFIRQASAVRTPTTPTPTIAKSSPVQMLEPEGPPASEALTQQHARLTPVSGQSNVSDWMMRALDKYETMKTREQS